MTLRQHTNDEHTKKIDRPLSFFLAALAAVLLTMSSSSSGQSVEISQLQSASIVGTVTDVNHDIVPGATVILNGPAASDSQTVLSNDNGFFQFHGVRPGVPYQVSITAQGFADWQSPVAMLEPAQFKILPDIQLQIAMDHTTIQVRYDAVQVATEQVRIEEQQRVLGFIPNFYVVYDQHPEPLTTKLKFRLALKVASDPVTIAGVAFLSGIEQAGDRPNYGQGAQGYGKRVGATAAGNFTNIMVGGAILPSLLHQDPRYFYLGTGTTASRIRYAVMHPFVCKGDNGKWQPNYSSMGGDLASAALSNVYYPKADRGAGLVLSSFAIDTGARVVASLAQEFVVRRFTHKPDTK